MGKSTTIAIDKDVQKQLLEFIHNRESITGKRYSYSRAIKEMLDEIKEADKN